MQTERSRPKRETYKKMLREEAQERQERHDKLSTLEKIAKLDDLLGPNVGAKRERAKLKALLEGEAEVQEKLREAQNKKKEANKEKASKKSNR